MQRYYIVYYVITSFIIRYSLHPDMSEVELIISTEFRLKMIYNDTYVTLSIHIIKIQELLDWIIMYFTLARETITELCVVVAVAAAAGLLLTSAYPDLGG